MRIKILERDVKRAVLDWCAAERIFVQVRNVGAVKIDARFIRFAKPGQADLWGIHKGRHFECELKAPGKQPTDKQYEWLQDCRNAGAVAFWVDSLEEFIANLKTWFEF